ncbi:hypothetical protein C8R43DRAFT_39935 [Mycena crocata]|nr:hypothetical protein C8R43DRAFT_39935 [Mycena crocata]
MPLWSLPQVLTYPTMKLTAAFLALIPLVCAMPTPDKELAARTPGNVFVCIDGNFAGQCTTLHSASGQCVNVPLVFNDNISSVGPDAGQDCFFFTDANCGGSRLGPLRSPGNANLGGNSFNDAISSFQCFFG